MCVAPVQLTDVPAPTRSARRRRRLLRANTGSLWIRARDGPRRTDPWRAWGSVAVTFGYLDEPQGRMALRRLWLLMRGGVQRNRSFQRRHERLRRSRCRHALPDENVFR